MANPNQGTQLKFWSSSIKSWARMKEGKAEAARAVHGSDIFAKFRIAVG
jgi:hypothetical protein